MDDPFAVRTTEQRVAVLVLLLAYFTLFAVEFTTDNPVAGALGDVVVGSLAIPAGIIVARRATTGSRTDTIPLTAGVSSVIAGIGIGYGGIAALTDLPAIPVIEVVGSLALIVGVGLYLAYSWS